jgi:hypothetical protein
MLGDTEFKVNRRTLEEDLAHYGIDYPRMMPRTNLDNRSVVGPSTNEV